MEGKDYWQFPGCSAPRFLPRFASRRFEAISALAAGQLLGGLPAQRCTFLAKRTKPTRGPVERSTCEPFSIASNCFDAITRKNPFRIRARDGGATERPENFTAALDIHARAGLAPREALPAAFIDE